MPPTADTAARLLTAARERIVALGWQAASSRHIVGAAGVPLGAVNYHFGARETLLRRAAIDEVEAMFGTPWRRLQESGTVDELLDALLGWVRAQDVTPQQQALLLEVMAQSRRDHELAGLLRVSLGHYRAAVAAAVARVTGCSAADAADLADALVAQTNGLFLQTVVEDGARLEESCAQAVAAWREALGRLAR